MRRRLRLLLLRTFGRLPWRLRSAVLRWMAPAFRVGALCVVERPDGALLLVRHSYRGGWGFPGGLLAKGEAPPAAARREAMEELGLAVELDRRAHVVVDPRFRRVDVIYRAHLGPGSAPEPVPRSAEILEARWFPPAGLPPLGKEAAAALAELGGVH